MKRKIIIACVLLLLPLGMKAQSWGSCFPNATVIGTISAHVPNYLYHDNPWYDSPIYSGTNFIAVYIGGGDAPAVRAHFYITEEPLDIIGIAGSPVPHKVGASHIGANNFTADTSMEGRLPEFFHLYEATTDTFVLVGEVRWDTCSRIKRLYAGGAVFDVCEALFDKPVMVEDSFYVGFTSYNNVVHYHQIIEREEGGIIVPYYYNSIYDHITTCLGGISTFEGTPVPINHAEKFRYLVTDIPIGGLYNDTLWHHLPTGVRGNNNIWWFLWPIFDTTGMACHSVSQLAVTPIENQSTTLTWSAPSGQIIWDVEYGRSDASRSSYTQTRVRNTPYLTLSNLDTGTYYTVFVRAMCDIGDYSNWSDSLVFYVPDDSSNVGIRALEMYTNLFPNPASDQAMITSSFGINGVEVYSLKGELMEHSPRDGATVANIDLQRYPAGSYIVRIRTPKGIVARRLEVVR